jgi:hypothetical protein
MFDNLTISPVSNSEVAGRMALAIACSAAMFALAVAPAVAANTSAPTKNNCQAVSPQAATFARVQLGVVEAC